MTSKTITYYIFIISLCFISSCKQNDSENKTIDLTEPEISIEPTKDTITIDCNYSFDEAIAGTEAPQTVIDQLTLIQVQYYSFDSLLHQGQIICHQSIAENLVDIFQFIREIHFPVEKVIPIVKYNHDDIESMNDNNTYCFCYRDVTYSKHATGMAIDINPMQNPLRWKESYKYRKDLPENATFNPDAPGTLHPQHPVVLKFEEKGFLWGHNFRRNHDDHHFETRR